MYFGDKLSPGIGIEGNVRCFCLFVCFVLFCFVLFFSFCFVLFFSTHLRLFFLRYLEHKGNIAFTMVC